MITQLELKNFRCFRELILNELKPITIFTGGNGVGKSTILEGLFLLFDRNNCDVFRKINAFRGLTHMYPLPSNQWEHLFWKKQMDNPLSIDMIWNERKETLSIEKSESFSYNGFINLPGDVRSQIPTTSLPKSYPIKVTYSTSDANEMYHLVLTDTYIQQHSSAPLSTETRTIHYISSRTVPNIAELMTYLKDNGLVERLVSCLKFIDTRIKDVYLGVDAGAFDVRVNMGSFSGVSVNNLGDGINKLFYIVLILLTSPKSIVLIDEIENGFHHSRLFDIWNVLAELTDESGSQIFLTTHSYECLENAAKLQANNPELFSKLFQLIRLEWQDDQIVPHKYGVDSFSFALANNWEVR